MVTLDPLTTGKLAVGFVAVGQLLKQHPRIKNEHLRWLLPLIALALGVAAITAEVVTHVPLTEYVVFVLGFLTAAVGADVIKQIDKQTPGTLLAPGTEVEPEPTPPPPLPPPPPPPPPQGRVP